MRFPLADAVAKVNITIAPPPSSKPKTFCSPPTRVRRTAVRPYIASERGGVFPFQFSTSTLAPFFKSASAYHIVRQPISVLRESHTARMAIPVKKAPSYQISPQSRRIDVSDDGRHSSLGRVVEFGADRDRPSLSWISIARFVFARPSHISETSRQRRHAISAAHRLPNARMIPPRPASLRNFPDYAAGRGGSRFFAAFPHL